MKKIITVLLIAFSMVAFSQTVQDTIIINNNMDGIIIIKDGVVYKHLCKKGENSKHLLIEIKEQIRYNKRRKPNRLKRR